jgi:hypothetical protein
VAELYTELLSTIFKVLHDIEDNTVYKSVVLIISNYIYSDVSCSVRMSVSLQCGFDVAYFSGH